MDEERVSHNQLIASDLRGGGFDIRFNHKVQIIVSLNRVLFAREIRTFLDELEYDGLYTAKQHGRYVLVDAVC